MSDRWREKTQNNHNANNTTTRNIHGGKNSIFSRNIFGGARDLNIDIVKPSMKKKKKKTLEDDMTQKVNKCVKLKSKLQLNVL